MEQLYNYVEKYLKINTNNLYIIGIVILCSIWKSLRLSIVIKQIEICQLWMPQRRVWDLSVVNAAKTCLKLLTVVRDIIILLHITYVLIAGDKEEHQH